MAPRCGWGLVGGGGGGGDGEVAAVVGGGECGPCGGWGACVRGRGGVCGVGGVLQRGVEKLVCGVRTGMVFCK